MTLSWLSNQLSNQLLIFGTTLKSLFWTSNSPISTILAAIATFVILLIIGWFLLVSPYSGPVAFIYDQF